MPFTIISINERVIRIVNRPDDNLDGDQDRGTLARGLRILSILGEAGRPIGLSELTRLSGLSKPTVHRVARSLVDLGYVAQSDPPLSQYSLRSRVLELGYTYLAGLEVRERARPFMLDLAAQFGENVSLSVLDGAEVVYVERLEGKSSGLMFRVAVGTRIPTYCSSMGKAFLAWLPEKQVSAIIDALPFEQLTETTITSREQLDLELKNVRENGFSINDQEMSVGVRSVGAPIFGDKGFPIATINVSGPAVRLPRSFLEHEVSPILRKYATEISQSKSALYPEPRSANER